MIILQTGVPGSGKTANIVNLLLNDKSYTHFEDKDGVVKRRPLFVNGFNDLKIEHQELDDEQIKSQAFQDFLPYGSLIVIDEVQRLMGTRSAASKVPDFIQALATHRHHGLDIILITQHPSFLDPFVRKLVQRHMHVSIKPIGRKIYEWNECVDQPDSTVNIAKAVERQFSVPKKAFEYYKSAEVHTKPSRKLPKVLIFLIFFVPFVLWFGFNTYTRMSEKYNINKSTEQTTAQIETTNTNDLNNKNIYTNQNNNYINSSVTAQMLVPTIPEKPETKPLYDNVRQVKTFETVRGCFKGGKSVCFCISHQGTKLPEISKQRCLKYLEDGLPFDPYRDEQQQAFRQPETTIESTNQTIEQVPQVAVLGGEPKVPKTEEYPENLRNIQ